jgi:hypothetical protein
MSTATATEQAEPQDRLVDYFEPTPQSFNAPVTMLALSVEVRSQAERFVSLELLTDGHASAFGASVRRAEEGMGYLPATAPAVVLDAESAERLWKAIGQALGKPAGDAPDVNLLLGELHGRAMKLGLCLDRLAALPMNEALVGIREAQEMLKALFFAYSRLRQSLL